MHFSFCNFNKERVLLKRGAFFLLFFEIRLWRNTKILFKPFGKISST